MKIAFLGSTDFTKQCLKKAQNIENAEIVLTVARPDKKRNRKGKLVPSAFTEYCKNEGIKHLQPETINSEDFIKTLKETDADIFIVVAYGEIMKKEVIQIPKIGAFNIHASLLPKYRGASPIEHALLNGEKESGVSLQKIDVKMDAGDIVLQEKIKIGDEWTYFDLYESVKSAGAMLTEKFLKTPEELNLKAEKQNEDNATYCYKIKKEDGNIDWNKSAEEIHNAIRAYAKWPQAHTFHDGKSLKIYRSKISNTSVYGVENYKNGSIMKMDGKQGIFVKTNNGVIILTEMQLEGKKKQNAADFLNGCRFNINDVFSKER